MLRTTLTRLKCPACHGALDVSPKPESSSQIEIRSGYLVCRQCNGKYLILHGIPLLVKNTRDYLLNHVKGISKIVPDQDIPPKFRPAFLEAKSEISAEHIEEDLEAERVNALYLMNHYLKADSKLEWWKTTNSGSPLIDQLIREHWDNGPFSQIKEWVSDFAKKERFKAALELGCGVGGLHLVLKPTCDFYLGVDSSFASIALARHIALGAPYPGTIRIPQDLIQGGLSLNIKIPTGRSSDDRADFAVMEFENPAIAKGWDLTLSLNMIDMLNKPEDLPRLHFDLLVKDGITIHSCPYVWHESVTKRLRKKLPPEVRENSARAVEWLYQDQGFKIEKSVEHRPWLFYKHFRQLEIYSTHMFAARK